MVRNMLMPELIGSSNVFEQVYQFISQKQMTRRHIEMESIQYYGIMYMSMRSRGRVQKRYFKNYHN